MHGSTRGRWKRVDGGSYTGTKLETAETAKDLPVRYRATALLYWLTLVAEWPEIVAALSPTSRLGTYDAGGFRGTIGTLFKDFRIGGSRRR